MTSVPPRERTIPTRRTVITGSRAELRARITELAESGRLLTFGPPRPIRNRPGLYGCEVFTFDPRPGDELEPVRYVIPRPTPAPAASAPVRVHPAPQRPARDTETLPAAVKHTAVIVAAATAAGGLAWGIYELVVFVSGLVSWLIAHGQTILGALLVLALIAALGSGGAAACHCCGRKL